MNELELIAETQAGRTEAFGPLYDAYAGKIYRYLYYRLHDRETAEDITSQVFLKAVEKIGSFNPRKGNFSGWIYRIARNALFDHWRANEEAADLEEAGDVPSGDSPLRNAETGERMDAVMSYLNLLPKEQRDIVLLRAWDGLSYKEIAEITGKSEANSQMIFARTIAKIQKSLGPAALVLFLAARM